MGKLHKSFNYLLGLFCAAFIAFPALAADKVNLPVDRNGFFRVSGDTFRYPTTAKIREAVSAANPHVERLPGGGLSQSLPSNIEITATGQSSPISAKVKAGVPALKNGAKSLFKGGLVGIGLTYGLEQLLDGIDALIEDGQVVQRKIPDDMTPPAGSHIVEPSTSVSSSTPAHSLTVYVESIAGYGNIYYRCRRISSGFDFVGYNHGSRQCIYMPDGQLVFDSVPMSDAAIDDAVDNYYEPEPEDWHLLARHIDPSDPDVRAEISDIPSLLTPPTTKTIYDANGNPVQVQETNIWYDFDITDNDSKQPAIDIKERKETKTYNEHGELTGTETTISTSKASSSSSSSATADFDIPTDCEFMPTVCRFLAWFQEPDPELSNEPDLDSLRHDLEPDRSFEVGSSTAGCPEPITISLAMFPSVEVSLQPLCDFVDLLRPLLLAFASYFATLIVLRAF